MIRTGAGGLLWVPIAGCATTQVEQIRYTATAEATRVTINLSAPTSYKLFTLSNPERVVIDLSDARLATSLKGLNYSGTRLTSIRSGPRPEGGLRLVFDVAVKPRPKSFLLQPADDQGLRLVVDMPTSPAVAAAPARAAASAPTGVSTVAPPPVTAAPAAASARRPAPVRSPTAGAPAAAA